MMTLLDEAQSPGDVLGEVIKSSLRDHLLNRFAQTNRSAENRL